MSQVMKRLLAGLLLAIALPTMVQGSAIPQPKSGEIPPDNLGRDVRGQPVTVSQHKGKVVIVTFWASWCGPCRHELPILGKLQKAVGREHLEVVAVNYREDKRELRSLIRAHRDIDLTYVHDATGAISDRYGVRTLPNMFVIDREGRVAHVHRGYSEKMLDKFIQEMLALLPPEVLARPASG